MTKGEKRAFAATSSDSHNEPASKSSKTNTQLSHTKVNFSAVMNHYKDVVIEKYGSAGAALMNLRVPSHLREKAFQNRRWLQAPTPSDPDCYRAMLMDPLDYDRPGFDSSRVYEKPGIIDDDLDVRLVHNTLFPSRHVPRVPVEPISSSSSGSVDGNLSVRDISDFVLASSLPPSSGLASSVSSSSDTIPATPQSARDITSTPGNTVTGRNASGVTDRDMYIGSNTNGIPSGTAVTGSNTGGSIGDGVVTGSGVGTGMYGNVSNSGMITPMYTSNTANSKVGSSGFAHSGVTMGVNGWDANNMSRAGNVPSYGACLPRFLGSTALSLPNRVPEPVLSHSVVAPDGHIYLREQLSQFMEVEDLLEAKVGHWKKRLLELLEDKKLRRLEWEGHPVDRRPSEKVLELGEAVFDEEISEVKDIKNKYVDDLKTATQNTRTAAFNNMKCVNAEYSAYIRDSEKVICWLNTIMSRELHDQLDHNRDLQRAAAEKDVVHYGYIVKLNCINAGGNSIMCHHTNLYQELLNTPMKNSEEMSRYATWYGAKWRELIELGLVTSVDQHMLLNRLAVNVNDSYKPYTARWLLNESQSLTPTTIEQAFDLLRVYERKVVNNNLLAPHKEVVAHAVQAAKSTGGKSSGKKTATQSASAYGPKGAKPANTPACRFFRDTGSCKFGDKCRFSHDSSVFETPGSSGVHKP